MTSEFDQCGDRWNEMSCTLPPGHSGMHVDERVFGPAGTVFHRAEEAEERGEGICRTCLAPIWFEQGKVGGHTRTDPDWSDRIERGGDSLVCFKATHYRHEPLTGREAAIYDRAYQRGAKEARRG